MAMTPGEEEAVQRSMRRRQPYGSAQWQKRTAARLGLESDTVALPTPRPTTKES